MILAPTDTIPNLARKLRDEQAAAKEARVKGDLARAKTNLQALIAVGVVCTPDDEMDRAYRHEMLQDRAKAGGVTFREAEAAWEQEKAEEDVVRMLADVVRSNETSDEATERVRGILDLVPPGTRHETIKGVETPKVCRHTSTRAGRQGWRPWAQGNDDDGRMCFACGAYVAIERRTEPTEQARVALIILQAAAATRKDARAYLTPATLLPEGT